MLQSFSGVVTKKSAYRKAGVAFSNAYKLFLVLQKGAVPVLCMLTIKFVILKQRYRKAYMVLCRDWKTVITLLFLLCIIQV